MPISRNAIISLAVFQIMVLAFGVLVSSNSYLMLLTAQVLLFAAFVAAWNIIGGLAGQLDLASSAYLALGGIVTSLLWMTFDVPPIIGVFIGGLAAMSLAIVIGIPTFKFGVREVWYALMTASLVVVLNNLFRYFMGPWDFYLPPRWGWLYLRPRTYFELFLVIDAVLILVVLVNIYISNSKIGYYLRSIREDELASEAIGIDTRLYKLVALATYSFITGAIGYLQIVIYSSFSYRLFDTGTSISIAIMGIIGGLGSISGSIASAIMFRTLGEYLRSSFGGVFPGLDLLLYGTTLIVVGIVKPEGLAGLFNQVLKRWSRG
ncbi:MAG: branched-chain amino acid ABC transporter permease [Desulfurococcaceae archaeon]